jgi:phospholipid/cholesterol/gamma-HCH transport system substrate-binding protein
MIKANKIKLGLFFSTAISLIIFGFIVIGSLKILQPNLRAMTVVDSSVEGLSVGSPVKYLGVTIGQVYRISLRNTDGYIDIYFKILPSSVDVIGDGGQPETSREPDSLINLLQRDNTSCRINKSGIMGGGFLELTVSNTPQWALPELKITPPEETIYVRSVSSNVPNAIQNLSNTLEKISQIDFVKLVDKIDKTLDEADDLFNNAELSSMLTRFNRISIKLESNLNSLQKMFTPESVEKYLVTVDNLKKASGTLNQSLPREKLKSIVDNLESASRHFNSALPPEKMKTLVNTMEADLKSLNKLLVNTDKSRAEMIKMVYDLRYQFEVSLLKLNHTLQSVSDLSNSLNDNPEQLLRGKGSQKKAY